MTMEELKSVEETIVRVSLKTLYFIGAALVGASLLTASLYSDIIRGQEQILAEVKKNAIESQYKVEDIKKDIGMLDFRLTKVETQNQ